MVVWNSDLMKISVVVLSGEAVVVTGHNGFVEPGTHGKGDFGVDGKVGQRGLLEPGKHG